MSAETTRGKIIGHLKDIAAFEPIRREDIFIYDKGSLSAGKILRLFEDSPLKAFEDEKKARHLFMHFDALENMRVAAEDVFLHSENVRRARMGEMQGMKIDAFFGQVCACYESGWIKAWPREEILRTFFSRLLFARECRLAARDVGTHSSAGLALREVGRALTRMDRRSDEIVWATDLLKARAETQKDFFPGETCKKSLVETKRILGRFSLRAQAFVPA